MILLRSSGKRKKRSAAGSIWSDKKAIKRAQRCLGEFEEASFSRRKPLTFEDVPWPVLADRVDVGAKRYHEEES